MYRNHILVFFEASFAIKLGESSSLPQSPYLIRTAIADFSRLAKAVVSILENFKWKEVAVIYEDTKYGNAIFPYLTNAVENSSIHVFHKTAIPTSADDVQISEELKLMLATVQSKVLVVHMTSALASRLLVLANKAGILSQGYSWLVTDGFSNFVETMDPIALDSMKGVIGVRPYVPNTKGLKNFKTRYKSLSLMNQSNETSDQLNIVGLWAYDTIWALAMTVERIGTMNSSSPREILEEILGTGFRGISGDFDLVNGQLQPSIFQVFDLTESGQRIIGYWNLDQGYLVGSAGNKLMIKKIIRPEDGTRRNLGEMPAVGHYIIGVPMKPGFPEFINIDPNNYNKINFAYDFPGFSIEVFESVWNALALPNNATYEFLTVDGTYDELCCKVDNKNIHAAVGDISIVASRTNCVDFTLPYLESEVTMLIKVSHAEPTSMWIFLKPLSWDLWLTIICICIFIGFVVRVLDRRGSTLFSGSRRKQLSTILMFPCLSVAIPQRDMVATNCSRLVLVLWIFLAFVLMQSYTANLSSILTVKQLQPTIPTLKELQKQYVGYQDGSFVKGLLINQLGFKEEMLRPYGSAEDYREALCNGSDNGGVAAIFDEIPYIKLFLAEYTTGYVMAGPTYRTDGLGFAFPIGSPLVANFSRAILNFTQGKNMTSIEKKYFGKLSVDQYDTGPVSSSSPSLSTRSFGGLFLIIGIVVLLAMVVSENHILGTFIRRYIFRCISDDDIPGSIQPTSEDEMTETNNQENRNQMNRNEPTEEATIEVQSS
ncbi:Ionotropic glutamate receptor [Corchorus olitorius]|uniref:Glutamate receptor n=1 Tax=Corchorus olitorius TaxID=93759 RepID=A0A1R3J4V9_9ROSI|nr:Ionotropic glutamate receptor [Corchorus olitorius]